MDHVKRFPVVTDGRGARGYSGSGYVYYLGQLSVIHIGKAPKMELDGSIKDCMTSTLSPIVQNGRRRAAGSGRR